MLEAILVTPAAVPVLTTAEAKLYCHVTNSAEDGLIDHYIASATQFIQNRISRALINQTWKLTVPYLPVGEVIGLPIRPVQSITTVTYWDENNAPQTLDGSVYTVLTDERGAFLTLQVDQEWPTVYPREDGAAITFVAGYGATAADVPADLKQAVYAMTAHMYTHRGDSDAPEMPPLVKDTLAHYRWW